MVACLDSEGAQANFQSIGAIGDCNNMVCASAGFDKDKQKVKTNRLDKLDAPNVIPSCSFMVLDLWVFKKFIYK